MSRIILFSKGNDILFLNIILHVCGQINILRIHFINFDVTSPRIYNRFNELIQRHRYLITMARELADLISSILLIELFMISILLCIMGEYYVRFTYGSAKYMNCKFIYKFQRSNILFYRISVYLRIKSQKHHNGRKEFNSTGSVLVTTIAV